jgi:aspartate ammonia-lyase
MPGKINPVIPEVVNQISFRVIGSDLTVTMAAASGQLQLNAFEPIIAYSIFESVRTLTDGCRILADKCIDGITANVERCRSNVERSPGLATFLNPYIGYERAAEIAKECLKTGTPVAELVLRRGWMTKEELAKVLLPKAMTSPAFRQTGRRKAKKKEGPH